MEKSNNALKIGAAVVLLGIAGYFAYGFFLRSTPAELVQVDFVCMVANCNTEFRIPRGEVDRMAKAREAPKCPKCSTYEVERGHRCGNCDRVNKPIGHGSAPLKCTYCKKTWTYDPPPK